MRVSLRTTARVICLAALPVCASVCSGQTNQPDDTSAPAQTSPAVPEAPPVLVAPQPHIAAGQPFSVKGKLQVKYRGWGIYLTVPLEHRTLADLGGSGAKYITAIQVKLDGNWKPLTKHVGEVVEATGKLQMGSATSAPFWNGVMLVADTVKLADGSTLQAHPADPPTVPAGVTSYMVTVTMQPNHIEWPHEAVDTDSGAPLAEADVDGCALSGEGNVMNCACVEGFAPLRAGVVAHPVAAKDWLTIPAATTIDPATAQFPLPDPDANGPQIFQVVCKRKSKVHP